MPLLLYQQPELKAFAEYVLSTEREQSIALTYDPNDGLLFDDYKKIVQPQDMEKWHELNQQNMR